MTREELKKIDRSLDVSDLKDKILIDKKGYFLYYNEPNKNEKDIKIHKHDSGFCAWGSGNGRENKIAGKNGVWIGPFESSEQAENFVRNVLDIDDVSPDTCCKI
jgi:hypothetical protein